MADPALLTDKNDPARRSAGVVYLDPSLADKSATHALLIGVGAYQSSDFPDLLDTATISARTMADWFLAKPDGFANQKQSLGSLALLLSEQQGTDEAEFSGGPVPRATFAQTKAAVLAWLKRVNSDENNLAIVYVASHGESFGRRTAFLLEDYGTGGLGQDTFGMADVEQFIASLENAKPIQQLLVFDCCRMPGDMELPWDETLGDKLISLGKQNGDHGIARRQWVICSTTLGEAAIGLKGKPTLFTGALMDALRGVAGDPTTKDWPVRPGALVEQVSQILELHQLPDEEMPQIPSGRMAGRYDITFPGKPRDVPVYVSLDDPSDWPGAELSFQNGAQQPQTVTGKAGESPFQVWRAPERAEVEITAASGGVVNWADRIEVRAPATFVRLVKGSTLPRPSPVPVARSPMKRGRIASVPRAAADLPPGRLEVMVDGPARFNNAAVLDVALPHLGGTVKSFPINIGEPFSIPNIAGRVSLVLRTPDGRRETREVLVQHGETTKVVFEMQPSPHEGLAAATIMGAIPRDAKRSDQNTEGRSKFSVNLVALKPSLVTIDLAPPAGEPLAAEMYGPGDFARVDIPDRFADAARFDRWFPPTERLLVRVAADSRPHLASLPISGHSFGEVRAWLPHLVVQRIRGRSRISTTVIVEDQSWSGLLGFLAAREFPSGMALLKGSLASDVEWALLGKRDNPLAAAAAALIAVATADPVTEEAWDPWLRNLASWFPFISDGPIILARRLLARATTAEAIAEAAQWFAEGYRRGIPYYSLSVDWLARGLESLPDEGTDIGAEDLAIMRTGARRLANRVDANQAFTVIRL